MERGDSIRVVRAFGLSPIRSQAIYHAVAEAFDEKTLDTICLVRPTEPYICIGYHQDARQELELEQVSELQFPVIRRQVGGGAVYLDENQIFLQWIFSPRSLPLSIEARYQVFIEPIVATYRAMGIPAHIRPMNDIQVNGRKIGGCGAARIGDAELLVSSFMFDIDLNAMARVLKVDSQKMRDKLYRNLAEYVTSINRELESNQDPDTVIDGYLARVAQQLGRTLIEGDLSEAELEQLRDVESRMSTDEWTYGGGGRKVIGVQLQQGVHMHRESFKAPGGMVRWVVFLAGNEIRDASLEGDFTIYPLDAPARLATALIGHHLGPDLYHDWEALVAALVEEAPGVTAADLFAPLETLTTRLSTDARDLETDA